MAIRAALDRRARRDRVGPLVALVAVVGEVDRHALLGLGHHLERDPVGLGGEVGVQAGVEADRAHVGVGAGVDRRLGDVAVERVGGRQDGAAGDASCPARACRCRGQRAATRTATSAAGANTADARAAWRANAVTRLRVEISRPDADTSGWMLRRLALPCVLLCAALLGACGGGTSDRRGPGVEGRARRTCRRRIRPAARRPTAAPAARASRCRPSPPARRPPAARRPTRRSPPTSARPTAARAAPTSTRRRSTPAAWRSSPTPRRASSSR